MLCVSIDVSADNFHVAIYYPNSELFKLSSFSQSRNGFDDFKSILLNLDDEIYIALEAAGSYSHNLFSQKTTISILSFFILMQSKTFSRLFPNLKLVLSMPRTLLFLYIYWMEV